MELTTADWKREAAIRTLPVLPQQHNGSDCGMFTLMFADFISDNLDLGGFSQSDIKDYRRKVAAAILRGSLNYEMY
jgi:sentrin-specific protease 1